MSEGGTERIPPLNLTDEEADYLWEMIKREIGKEEVWDGDETETVRSLHTKIGEVNSAFDDEDDDPELVTDGGVDGTGVEQLPEKWRRRAEKAQEAGHTEKAIAVLDCADELEERMGDDDDPEIRADGSGGTKYGDKLPEGGTDDLYADDEGNGASWTEETSARSIEIEVQLHEEGYQNDRKWTVHCSDPFEDHTVVARFGVEHQNKGNYWRPGDRWDDAVDFEDLPLPVRRRVAAVLNRSLDEITPEHRTVHREDGMGMADEAGDRDE